MRAITTLTIALVTALVLAGCGGSATNTDAGAVPGRGTLLKNPPDLAITVSAPAMLLELAGLPDLQLLSIAGNPVCDVAVYHLQYRTVGGSNESTTASGALMVPFGGAAKCHGSRPIVLYAHGTTTDRDFNIASLHDKPNGEGLAIAALFATQGYIVVAPNFAGYDSSTLPYHPYLIADQQSKDMIDALAAARRSLPTAAAATTRDDGRVYITGYSQGGYVAMATHRAMQAAGMAVTASAPMSGPYALAAFVDAIFAGRVNGGAPVSAALLITAYQRAYGNMYSSPTEVFEPQYAPGIETLLPSTLLRSELYAQGKLPARALFSPTPPSPEFSDITPATTPANLSMVFARGFGAGNLVRNEYRLTYLLDEQAHPDGGWPTTTTGGTASSPGLPLRQALKRNDLRDWTPSAPVLMCGGSEDPTVFWFNTQLMQGYWATRVVSPGTATALDLDSGAPRGDPYADLKSQFGLAKQLVAAAAVAQGATDGGAVAVAEAYHVALVAPFCLAAVKSFFDAH
jgi:hypothetical protein